MSPPRHISNVTKAYACADSLRFRLEAARRSNWPLFAAVTDFASARLPQRLALRTRRRAYLIVKGLAAVRACSKCKATQKRSTTNKLRTLTVLQPSGEHVKELTKEHHGF